MPKQLNSMASLLLLVLFLSAAPVISQQCELEDIEDVAREILRDKVSGTGFSWTDVLSRLIAQVDSLDLDSGDTSTVLTWNINKYLTAQASVVNEPDLFSPLKEAIGDNADLLAKLSDQVGQGGDWQVSVDLNFQNKKMELGTRTVSEKAVTDLKSGWKTAMEASTWGTAVAGALKTISCSEKAQFYKATVPAVSLFMAEYKPKSLTANAFFRSRDDLVGQDEMGVSFKYSYGFSDTDGKRSEAAQQSLLASAFVLGIKNVAAMAGQESPDAASSITALTASAIKAVSTAMEELPSTVDHRLAVEAQWKRKDDYVFSLQLANPLVLPEDESLTVKLAYSLQFRRDGKDLEELPRFELSASYEDVDNDAARQSRFIAKAIATQKLNILGENTELTAGLVYANKPEYLADQEFDEQLSANLGLTFKVGRAN